MQIQRFSTSTRNDEEATTNYLEKTIEALVDTEAAAYRNVHVTLSTRAKIVVHADGGPFNAVAGVGIPLKDHQMVIAATRPGSSTQDVLKTRSSTDLFGSNIQVIRDRHMFLRLRSGTDEWSRLDTTTLELFPGGPAGDYKIKVSAWCTRGEWKPLQAETRDGDWGKAEVVPHITITGDGAILVDADLVTNVNNYQVSSHEITVRKE